MGDMAARKCNIHGLHARTPENCRRVICQYVRAFPQDLLSIRVPVLCETVDHGGEFCDVRLAPFRRVDVFYQSGDPVDAEFGKNCIFEFFIRDRIVAQAGDRPQGIQTGAVRTAAVTENVSPSACTEDGSVFAEENNRAGAGNDEHTVRSRTEGGVQREFRIAHGDGFYTEFCGQFFGKTFRQCG